MYLNFSNFRGRTSAGGGGNKPWSKNGDKCWMGGGIDKIFAGWGTPSPPGKKKTWPLYFPNEKTSPQKKLTQLIR